MLKEKRLVLLILMSLLAMGFSASNTHSNQDGNVTFKTPEDAITYYLQGVAQGDFNKVIQACAIDQISQNIKFDQLIDRLQAFVPYQSLAPSTAPMYVELNKAQLTGQIANQVKILVYSLLSTQPVGNGTMIKMDMDGATKFMGEVDVKKLAQLQIKKINLPNTPMMNKPKYLENEAKMARIYGADEATERVALYSLGSDYYFSGFSLLRYGDDWKIYNQSSPLGNTTSTGAAAKTTPEDFDKLVNGQ